MSFTFSFYEKTNDLKRADSFCDNKDNYLADAKTNR